MATGPIVLKGIQTVKDAKKAVEAGMAGIIVSNRTSPFTVMRAETYDSHIDGGRQVDGSVPSLDCLPPVRIFNTPSASPRY